MKATLSGIVSTLLLQHGKEKQKQEKDFYRGPRTTKNKKERKADIKNNSREDEMNPNKLLNVQTTDIMLQQQASLSVCCKKWSDSGIFALEERLP